MRSLWLSSLLWSCSVLSAPRVAADEALRKVPLLLHVAEHAGVPVADAAFLRQQVEFANLIYRAVGLELVVVKQQRLASRHARLVQRRDRDALQTSLQPGVVNWFVVATLMDVDEPGRERRGVHWRVRSDPRKHFVVVSAASSPFVLAHELGHFFGNQEHSEVPGNLMSYQQTDAVPVLDQVQKSRILTTLHALIERNELALVTPTATETTAPKRD
ncbi:MAG: hypothetical protein JWN04_5113 [Myxococcaceae bacterium]|nr:hypothetical protein [Myxococcaceae bacterium]